MNEIQMEIREALMLVQEIPVCRENVERMALAKGRLGRAFELAGQAEQREAAEDGE